MFRYASLMAVIGLSITFLLLDGSPAEARGLFRRHRVCIPCPPCIPCGDVMYRLCCCEGGCWVWKGDFARLERARDYLHRKCTCLGHRGTIFIVPRESPSSHVVTATRVVDDAPKRWYLHCCIDDTLIWDSAFPTKEMAEEECTTACPTPTACYIYTEIHDGESCGRAVVPLPPVVPAPKK
jgi:hypothetical protein